MNRTGRIPRIVIVLLFLFAAWPLATLADDWLAIPPADVALKDNPKQPGADAMVLYREVNVDARESTVNNYLRIKIFTPAGVKSQADIEIPYDKVQESIQAVRARTIRPDGSISDFDGKTFDKEIVKGNGIKYLAKTFTMPDVQPGSIVEYKYREQFDDRYYQNLGWVVQYDLYTRLARFSIKPDDSMSALPLLSRSYLLAGNTNPQKQANGFYTLEVHDLAGIDTEPLMPAPSALRARVEFYYKNGSEPATETPDQYWKRVGKSWSSDIDHFVDKKNALAAELSRDIASGDSAETKLRKLYARAAKIRNLDIEDDKTEKETKQEQIKPNNNVEDVLKHGYGRSFDINLLFLGLVRAAGFEAADLRVAPRSGMYFFPQRESARDLDAELVWVRADSKEYYLDPGARFYPFGILPWYETATNGVRVSKDGSEMILTPVAPSVNATIERHVNVTVDSNMDMSGAIQVDFSGQEAATRRYDSRNDDEAGRRKALGDEIKGWLPEGATVEVTSIANWEDIEKPLHAEGTLKIPSFASATAQRILMPLDFLQTSELGYFQSQKRVNEVDFSYAYETIDDLVIHMPAGYRAQSVPDTQKVNPGPVSYEIAAVQLPDGLKVTRHLVINGIRYPKESYAGLRSFFSIAKTNDNAQVMFQADRSAKNN